MPVIDPQDASDVEEHISRIFGASLPDDRIREIRRLFVEKLDFQQSSGVVSLADAPKRVDEAHRIATLQEAHVVYMHVGMSRVRKTEAVEAARLLSNQLGGDVLMVFTNGDADQLHLIYPTFEGTRPTLRRMVVERDLPRRTAVMQISNIFHEWESSGSIHLALESAFDVEAVTREFFKEYKRVFNAALEKISGFGTDESEQEAKKLFTQTLFNRLMFVYFISRKGWLSFDGDNDYLKALWRDYAAKADQTNFYNERLALVFFVGLNNPQSRDLNENNPVLYALIGAPPFLNGGLFEKDELDKREGITIPDSTIHEILSDLFDKFNFTVMESTPFDIEVAVDPEMLGKVFEELVTGRHESGSYYTPRPVVSFMCREALKGYLAGQDIGLDDDAIAAFVDEQDTTVISNLAQAEEIARALNDVTVVDPACGSGAYLLGMMQELVGLRSSLFNIWLDDIGMYKLKLGIIQRNLYGADIDPFAVNIAMLRLWLSLSIEYDAPGDPLPLPNLDFKVVRGDALLGPDPSAGVEVQGTLGQNVEQIKRLGDLKGQYLRAFIGAKKDQLREQIEKLTFEIRDALGASAVVGVVDWRVEFAEVFAARKGFDIAIANPPYVRYQQISRAYKTELKPIYGIATVGQSDLYCYFYARALQLIRDGGLHVFVCSNSWLDVGYGAKLQEYLLDNSQIHAIYESAVERQFSTADINTIISIISKSNAPDNSETRFVSLRANFEIALADAEQRREILKSRASLKAGGIAGKRYAGEKWGGKYLRAPDIYHHIMNKCADRFIRLGDIAIVKRGIITGANQFFFLADKEVEQWEIEEEFLQPIMTTPQQSNSISVDVETLPYRAFVCHQTKSSLRGTNALQYINWGEDKGFHRKSAPAARRLWYDLGHRDASQTAINIFVNTTARTVLASQPLLFSDNFQVLWPHGVDPITFCLSMNSSVSQLIVNVEGRTNFGQGVLEIQTYEIDNLRIVDPRLLFEPELSLFAATDWDVLSPSAERWQIDGMVFDALGLTAAERVAVYEGVAELVGNRKRRARSVPGTTADAGRHTGEIARNIVSRGEAIYVEKIRHKVEETERGKFSVIDVYSEDYEIDARHATASRRLVARRPGAVTYTVRIGHPTAYKSGLRSPVLN